MPIPTLPLTVREEQVINHLRAGRTTAKAMAHAMNLSPRTIEVYRRNILIKFGCHTMIELVRKLAPELAPDELKRSSFRWNGAHVRLAKMPTKSDEMVQEQTGREGGVRISKPAP